MAGKKVKKVLSGRASLRLGFPGELILKGQEVEFDEKAWKKLPERIKKAFGDPEKKVQVEAEPAEEQPEG
jgi:hypothetical protein